MFAAATKKAVKGRLKVKVTGSGTYTVAGKGVHKTGQTSRVFRVKVGRYTVKAPGASVKPAKIRVRAGKTARVTVRFSGAGAPPAVTPVPTLPPPSQPDPSLTVPPGGTTPGEQWVEAGAPATVTAPGGYSISIPAGVVQQRSLVTVTPQPPAEGTIPTVDVHIHGSWSGQVQVGVPLPAGATGAWPILVHDAADGTRISSGQAVSVSTVEGVRVVTASVSSLSQFQSWDQAICQSMSAEDRAASYLCANNQDRPFQKWFEAQGYASGARLGKDGGAREHPCHYSGGTAESVGTIPFGVSCSVTMEGLLGRFAFTNNFHGNVLGWSSGAVYGLSSRGGEVTRTTELPADIPWLLRPIADATSGSVLVPGSTVQYDKPLNSAETSLVVNADLAATGLYQGMQLLAGQLGEKALAAGASDPAMVLKFGSCASAALDDTVAGCFTDAVKQLLGSDAVIPVLGAGSSYLLKKILFWADIGSYAESLAFAAAAWQPKPEVLLSNVQVIDPPTDRGGNDYIARDPGTGRSVRFVNGKVYDIANGATFNCLATTRVIWDTPQLRALRQDPIGTSTCDNEGRSVWSYTPTASGGNTGTDVVLRNEAGNAWLINSRGEIQTIPDGGTYICLAATNPVIWNTPADKIDSWRPVGSAPAECGSPEPLPHVTPAPFSKLMSSNTLYPGWGSIMQPSRNGWWLMSVQLDTDEGAFERSYQWIGPDGREGPAWASTTANLAMATVGDRVFVTDGQLLRSAGPGGFERSTGSPADWGGGIGTLQAGADGFLYWLQETSPGESVIRQFDPNDLVERSRIRLTGLAPYLHPTADGLVAYGPNNYGGGSWAIDYTEFLDGGDTVGPEARSTLLPDEEFTTVSVGLDGGVSEATTTTDCSRDLGYRSASGVEWRQSVQALLGADFDDSCALGDVDSLPEGGVVVTLYSQGGGYLLEVDESGARRRLTKITSTGQTPVANEVADDGTVVTTVNARRPCPSSEYGDRDCGDVHILGTRDGQQLFSHVWTSPTGLLETSGLGFSNIYIGQQQVGAWVVQSCPPSRECQPDDWWVSQFRTITAPVALPLRSSHVPTGSASGR